MYSDGQMNGMGVSTLSGFDSNFTEGLDLNGDGDFYDDGEWLPWGPGALDFWGPPEGYSGGSGHTVLSGDHDVSEAVVPDIGSIAMFEESAGGAYVFDEATGEYVEAPGGDGTHARGFFHEQAGLKVISYEDGSWDAFDGDGVSVKSALGDVVSVSELYDARQASGSGQDTPILEIDIEALNASGHFPANGLLYAGQYGIGDGTDAKGLVVKNGSELLAPLSVVTEGALYVQGDYNTVSKKGASVMADAVNLLSNSWTGSKNPGQLPYASDTTFNVAIVTGNHETAVGHYNGGLENLPRELVRQELQHRRLLREHLDQPLRDGFLELRRRPLQGPAPQLELRLRLQQRGQPPALHAHGGLGARHRGLVGGASGRLAVSGSSEVSRAVSSALPSLLRRAILAARSQALPP
jgi:hypothetical protein